MKNETQVQHTPGPWTVDHEDPRGVAIASERDGIVAHADYTGDATITRANARLIAAAPDLLDALRPFTANAPYAADVTAAMMRDALAAIAKAEGGAL